jgi:hypothetical protein
MAANDRNQGRQNWLKIDIGANDCWRNYRERYTIEQIGHKGDKKEYKGDD